MKSSNHKEQYQDVGVVGYKKCGYCMAHVKDSYLDAHQCPPWLAALVRNRETLPNNNGSGSAETPAVQPGEHRRDYDH